MSWQFQSANAFEAARREWDEICRCAGDHILLDSDFVLPLVQHFGAPEAVLATSGKYSAMALLVRRGMGRWETLQPSQSPLGLIVAAGRDHRGDALQDLICRLPGYAIQLSVLHQDPQFSSWSAQNGNSRVEVVPYIDTPWMAISSDFAQYWASRSSNLRHNLARQRRKVQAEGCDLQFVVRTEPNFVPECIRAYGALESAGWKAGDGTAVTSGNAQGRFYTDVLRAFCARRQGYMFQLVLNDRVVASDLCLGRDGMLVVLKTTYDETLQHYSPSLLLREEAFRYIFATEQFKSIEFYGRQMDWHKKWTSDTRSMYHLNVYRAAWLAGAHRVMRAHAG